VRNAEPGDRGDLLQACLPVQAGAPGGHVGHQAVEQVMHKVAGRLHAMLQEYRADHCLHRVGQDRGLVPPTGALLAPTEVNDRTEIEIPGDVRQGPGVDHSGP
jgi:hypothetical protein